MILSTLFIALTVLLEPLPISSSGIRALLFGLWQGHRFRSFYITILDHLCHGFIAMVMLIFFRKRWLSFVRVSFAKTYQLGVRILMVGFITESITAMAYWYKGYAGLATPLWLGFLVTSVLLLSLFVCPPGMRTQLFLSDGWWLGFSQASALLMPGLSRLATTYTIARWRGCKARTAFEISWVIAFPLYCCAALRVLWYDLSLLVPYVHYWSVITVIASITIAYGCFHIVWFCVLRDRMWWWASITLTAALCACKMG